MSRIRYRQSTFLMIRTNKQHKDTSMHWRTFSIQTRILLGYALILVIVFGLMLYIVWSINVLNQHIQEVQRNTAADINVAFKSAGQVTLSQNTVDRYLQQPSPETLQEAQTMLNNLTTTMEDIESTTAAQQQQIEALFQLSVEYQDSFEEMHQLLDNQEPLRNSVQVQLTTASINVNNALLAAAQDETLDLAMLHDGAAIQERLRAVAELLSRMNPQNSAQIGPQAYNELAQAQRLLLRYEDTSGDVAEAFATVNRALSLVQFGIDQTVKNFQEIEDQYTELVDQYGEHMQQSVSAIERTALRDLATATQDLEQETQQLWLIALLGLLGTLLIAAVIGVGQSRSISRPIRALVSATQQIDQGNYDVVVNTRDKSESGHLAQTFNQMTTTLKAQRTDLLHQQRALQDEQAATAQRNVELEQALQDIQAATAARDALAQTVRALSVPIIPILQHVIVLPLVGEIDDERADLMMQQLLVGIADHQARIAIIDLTGVPDLDTLGATRLTETTTAARLVGARVILVGIRPALAQALLTTEADMSTFTTRANLRSAVEYALQQQGRPLRATT